MLPRWSYQGEKIFISKTIKMYIKGFETGSLFSAKFLALLTFFKS